MNVKELVWIKARQKEFRELFGSNLIVDFAAMNGRNQRPYSRFGIYEVDMEFVDTLMQEYGITLKEINSGRIKMQEKYIKFLEVLCKTALDRGWILKDVANIIGKHRTMIYYYGKNRKSLQTTED